MPLPQVNLDDVSWEELTAEARSLIPSYSSEWTNHNPSDPGMTLIELFAYVSEGLMYELDRISARNMIAFLRLINGPGWPWKKTLSLPEEKRAAVINMRRSHRAITAEDFETLALAVPELTTGRHRERIARAKCIFQRNLEESGEAAQLTDAPGHVSLVIVPDRRAHPSPELLWRIKQALDPARLITTRIHVVCPRFVTISVAITLVPRRGTDPKWLQSEAVRRLENFFDALHGGFEGTGWPFGRNVYLSEVYQLVDGIPGVDYVTRSKQNHGPEINELAVAPSQEDRIKRNKQGELEAIDLRPDELVSLWIEPTDITVAAE